MDSAVRASTNCDILAGMDGVNQVHLVGRISAAPEARRLPSGDEMVSWRLVVARPAPARGARVDTFDCVAFAAVARRAVLRLSAGDVVEIEGALRRRFWRSARGSPASRCEVEARKVRREARKVRRPARAQG